MSAETMFKSLGAALACLLASLIFILVTHKILKNRWLLANYKKLSNGMPIYQDFSLLCAHYTSVMLGQGNCQKIHMAHEKLGQYVSYLVGEKFCVSTTDLDLIKRIAIDEANLHLDRMSFNLPFNEFEESMMLAPVDRWLPQRRVFAAALRPNKFKAPNVVHEIEQSIGKLVGHLESRLDLQNRASKAGGVTDEKDRVVKVEVDDIIHRYSLDLVFSCFYKQYNQIDFGASVCEWTRAIDEMVHDFRARLGIRLITTFPWIRRPLDWFIWNFHKHGQTRRKILEFVKLQTKSGIEARRSNGGSRLNESTSDNLLLADGTRYKRNIIDHVIDGFLEGKISKSDYFNSSHFLVMAADKTAADCIVHTIYLLSIYPEVQERLRASIRTDGAESEYMNWVFNESLRLMPPVPGGCSRTISKSMRLENGMILPANTYVTTNAYAIHRLKQYWGEDAEEFKPERWADTSQHHPMQFIPFGAGPRGCPGREFALFTMKSLLASLLTRYKFEGNVRADVYKFSSPCFIFIIPNSPTYVTIKRVD